MIVCDDVLNYCADYDGPLFHACLCDPPYSLGFMGKDWDHDIAFQPETWAVLAEHLHPGAFGMAFASSRGWHRLAVAIEDAGLRIHPSIFGWAYGSGFPKATRIDTQVDKAAGAERDIAEDPYAANHPNSDIDGYSGNMHSGQHTAPATDLARAWAGHRYGLQAMKPALEPVIVFQVPYAGKPVESITKTGAGALWIEGARIGMAENDQKGEGGDLLRRNVAGYAGGYGKTVERMSETPGRWPANFYLDEEGARRLGEQSGESKSNVRPPTPDRENDVRGTWQMAQRRNAVVRGVDDTGTAARFFFQVNRQLDEADPVLYCAKASRKERDAGLDFDQFRNAHSAYGDYAGTPEHATNTKTWSRNSHPTVKPIDLARWLATLLLPPAEYAPRRILVPFAGSGSEMIGAHLAGWEEIVGIEREEEYVEIAEARVGHWCEAAQQLELVKGA